MPVRMYVHAVPVAVVEVCVGESETKEVGPDVRVEDRPVLTAGRHRFNDMCPRVTEIEHAIWGNTPFSSPPSSSTSSLLSTTMTTHQRIVF